MRVDRSVFGCAALTCVAALATIEAGQQPASRPTRSSTLVLEQAEADVDKAAADRKIVLTAEAKKVLAVEIVRQQSAMPDAASPEASKRGAQQVVSAVSDGAAPAPITGDQAQKRVSSAKMMQVTTTLDQEVATHLTTAGKDITDGARTRLVEDLRQQTEGLSKSGLPVDVIKSRNEAYLQAVDALVASPQIGDASYQQAREVLFHRLVNVSIDTTPEGSSVVMDGQPIGATTIADKPFEPGKSYHFEFTLAGYRPSTLDYFVAPAPDAQKISEALALDDVAKPSSDKGHESGAHVWPLPWIYSGIAIAAAVALLLVVRMSRGTS